MASAPNELPLGLSSFSQQLNDTMKPYGQPNGGQVNMHSWRSSYQMVGTSTLRFLIYVDLGGMNVGLNRGQCDRFSKCEAPHRHNLNGCRIKPSQTVGLVRWRTLSDGAA